MADRVLDKVVEHFTKEEVCVNLQLAGIAFHPETGEIYFGNCLGDNGRNILPLR